MRRFTPPSARVLGALLAAAVQANGCTSGTAPPQNCLNPQPIPPYCPFQAGSSSGSANADNRAGGTSTGSSSGAAPSMNSSTGGGSGSGGFGVGAPDASGDRTAGALDGGAAADASFDGPQDAASGGDGGIFAPTDGPEEADAPVESDTGEGSSSDDSNTMGGE